MSETKPGPTDPDTFHQTTGAGPNPPAAPSDDDTDDEAVEAHDGDDDGEAGGA